MSLTARGLAAIRPGQWLSDDGRRGAGRLAAFGMKSGGASFYFRYVKSDGSRDALALGHFDPKGRAGLTLQQASDHAGVLSRRYQSGERDLRAAIEAEATTQIKAEETKRAQAEALARRPTLGDLLSAYADALEAAGKTSTKKVRASLRIHVEEAKPLLWAKAVADITTDDAVEIVSRLHEVGTDREAAKVRSYLRAAFTKAINARLSPKASKKLRAMGVTQNPVAAMPVADNSGNDDQPTGTRDRALSLDELRAYWRRICDLPDPDGALLRLHLLSGGQRVVQLSRATLRDVDRDNNTLLILDRKGRRAQPRRHVVPLLPQAIEAIDALRAPEALGDYVFTVTAGLAPAAHHILQKRVFDVSESMVAASEAVAPFTPGDLRRTVETRLAATGLSREHRAQLQSHGLGGVQDRHYDRHSYLEEKRAALETLFGLLTAKAAKVVSIKRRKAGS